jgi:hypothetical protein
MLELPAIFLFLKTKTLREIDGFEFTVDADHATNLMPSIRPRRQITSQGCRFWSPSAKASSKRDGTTEDPSGTILAPLFERSMIWHSVVTTPLSVIQADCCPRLFVFGFIWKRPVGSPKGCELTVKKSCPRRRREITFGAF